MSRSFDINDYVTVQERIHIFWNTFPEGRILTKIIHLDQPKHTARMVVIKATIFKKYTKGLPDATGYAKEREGTRGANETAFVENCETSAIGRALANMDIAVSKSRPSQEEMLAVQATEREHKRNLGLLETHALTLNDDDETKVLLRKQWNTLKHSPIETFKLVQTLGLDTSNESEKTSV